MIDKKRWSEIQALILFAVALLIFISLLVVQVTMGTIKRERTIAFENPDGQVTISLSAIEDFIKRAMKQLPEVKESRPNVKASKKGITIVNKDNATNQTDDKGNYGGCSFDRILL